MVDLNPLRFGAPTLYTTKIDTFQRTLSYVLQAARVSGLIAHEAVQRASA